MIDGVIHLIIVFFLLLTHFLSLAFGGADSTRGNTGPFWVGSGKYILRVPLSCAEL
jgi:hypothetical protein